MRCRFFVKNGKRFEENGMKKRLKLIGFEILYIVLVTIASIAGAAAQFLGKKKVNDFSAYADSLVDYRYNPMAYLFGMFIFISALYGLYVWLLRPRITKESVKGIGIKIIYILTALVFSFIMFMIQCFELVMLIGFDDNILPESGQFITVFIWPLAVFVFTVGMMIWTVLKKEPEKTEPEKKTPAKKSGAKKTTAGKGSKSGKSTKK
jgi:glucan phosphoethanolaminetransferase (alkaline phosphatase superfamily)